MNQQDSILLGVNIDHIATLRQARGTLYPDPVQAAFIAEHAGADGITLHLREDRRHIKDRDVRMLKDVLQTRMNLEMAITDEMVTLAVQLRPQHCCLVPERREELTTEGGLDVHAQESRVTHACEKLGAVGIQVSLFIDPEKKQIDAALRCGASTIEIHTGHYAEATNMVEKKTEFNRILEAAKYAKGQELIVNAGHGLGYHNVQPIARISELTELNIGHSIIARAVFSGLDNAVREIKRLMIEARLFAMHVGASHTEDRE